MTFSLRQLLMVVFLFSSHASAASVIKPEILYSLEGSIFPKDSFPKSCKNLLQGAKCEEKSYGRALIESTKENEIIYNKSVFIGPEGEQQIEESWEKNGKVQKAITENRIIGKRMQLEVKNGKVLYQVTNLKDKSVSKSEDDAEENLVVPSTIMSYIRPLSERISKGEKIQVKIASLERMESYTFNIRKVRDEKTLNGDPVEVLELSPASLIIRALVDPMYFHINAKTKEMFAYEGESAVRRKVDGTWKKMQVFTSYVYKRNSAYAGEQDDCNRPDFLNGVAQSKCEIKQ